MDTAIREDIIVGRQPILDIMKLSDWRRIQSYLSMPGCPIYSSPDVTGKGRRVKRRYMVKRTLLLEWLESINYGAEAQRAEDPPLGKLAVHVDDQAIRDDLVIGRGQILYIMKLSHWDYMAPYLKLPGCPICQVVPEGSSRGRWMSRRSLLNAWLNNLMVQKHGCGVTA